MPESKLFDLKMLEKANYEKVDTIKLVELYMRAAKEKEEKLGAAYSATFIKYALGAVATQIGTKAPQEIKTLDQLKEYLISKMNELRTPPYLTVLWAHFVTDKKHGVAPGYLTQFMFKFYTQRLAERDFNIETQKLDVEQILTEFRKFGVDFKIAPIEFGYRKNPDGSIDIFHGRCHFFEGCENIWERNFLKKSDGRLICGIIQIVIQFLKAATGQEWDHAILEFDETRCMARCFPI